MITFSYKLLFLSEWVVSLMEAKDQDRSGDQTSPTPLY